jgi:hypothetical protein
MSKAEEIVQTACEDAHAWRGGAAVYVPTSAPGSGGRRGAEVAHLVYAPLAEEVMQIVCEDARGVGGCFAGVRPVVRATGQGEQGVCGSGGGAKGGSCTGTADSLA